MSLIPPTSQFVPLDAPTDSPSNPLLQSEGWVNIKPRGTDGPLVKDDPNKKPPIPGKNETPREFAPMGDAMLRQVEAAEAQFSSKSGNALSDAAKAELVSGEIKPTAFRAGAVPVRSAKSVA